MFLKTRKKTWLNVLKQMSTLDQMKLILFSFLSLQEFVETLQSRVSVSVLADLSGLHGLHDLSVLPHGLLASHHHLLLHPHLPAGNTQADNVSHTQHTVTPVLSTVPEDPYESIFCD